MSNKFDCASSLPVYKFSPQRPLLQASYEVAYQIAKANKPPEVGKKLIEPCVLRLVDIAFGEETATSVFIQ